MNRQRLGMHKLLGVKHSLNFVMNAAKNTICLPVENTLGK